MGNRRSIRLGGYDYTANGFYFVTICTLGRKSILGSVNGDMFVPGRWGEIVRECWEDLVRHHEGVVPVVLGLMPNHLHAILEFSQHVGARPASPSEAAGVVALRSLGSVIGSFKSSSTRRINVDRGTPGLGLWQRNFYERVIRNDRELVRVREYVETNPLRWHLDSENPDRLTGDIHSSRPVSGFAQGEAGLAPTDDLETWIKGPVMA
jgi:putative transposase